MTRISRLVVLLTLAAGGSAVAADPVPLPPDLALVPPGAVAFAHLRVADIRADAASAGGREVVTRTVPKGLAALDSQFSPKPSTYDRVTMFTLTGPPPFTTESKSVTNQPAPRRPGTPPPPEDVAVIVRCSGPVDRAAVLTGFDPAAKADGALHTDADGRYAVAFPDDVTAVFGSKKAVAAALVGRPAGGPHPLADSLQEAAGRHAATVGLVLPGGVNIWNTPVASHDLRSVVATLDLAAAPMLSARVRFATPAAAATAVAQSKQAGKRVREWVDDRRIAAENKLSGVRPGTPRRLTEMPDAVEGLATLAVEEWVAGLFAAPTVTQAGDTVTLAAPVDPLPARLAAPALAGFAWSLPGVALGARPEGMVRGVFFSPGPAPPSAIVSNLKRIVLAMHSYHDTVGWLPAAAPTARPGDPPMSWRVALLPLVGESALHQKFKFDEPWDSAHNKKVVADNPMPAVYALPGVTKPGDKTTHIQVFTGRRTLFDPAVPRLKMVGVTDGMKYTAAVSVAATPVEWTKPADIEFDPKADMLARVHRVDRTLQPAKDGVVWIGMVDGAVRSFSPKWPDRMLKAAITRDGNEVVDLEE